MHAADIVESLPTAGLDDEVLTALRTTVRHRLPGLVVTDETGSVVGCVSSIDLLRVTLPRYLHGDPRLARVIDETSADRIARTLTGVRIRDVFGHLDQVPGVRPQATVVELAEVMAARGCPIVLVEREDGGVPGTVTVNRLLELLVAAADEALDE
jgi:CBS-domain-containing membrane protein